MSDKLEKLQQQIKHLEDYNQGLRDRMEKLAEVSIDGHWDWHIKDDYEYMDARFWEIFGYDPATKKHHPSEWQSIIHPDDLNKALESFKKHTESGGKTPYWLEVRYKHKDGHWVWVICRGQVVEWDENGEAVRTVGTHTDITHMKKEQEELKK